MNIGAADFTVVFAAGAAGHQAIAKIDQTAQGDEGKENRLFEGNGVGNTGLFFQNGRFPNMGPQTRLVIAQKNRLFEISSLKFNIRSDLAIFHRSRCFIAQFDTRYISVSAPNILQPE